MRIAQALLIVVVGCSALRGGEAEIVVRVDPSSCKTEYDGSEITELRCGRIEGEGILRVRFARKPDAGTLREGGLDEL